MDFNFENSTKQSPQIPQIMPWSSSSMVAGKQPGDNNVVFFSAQTNSRSKPIIFQKRKSEIQAPLPRKQFISEEKITAHFDHLHISNDYFGQSNNVDVDEGEKMDFYNPIATATELEEKLKRASRITLCEEIKKINATSACSLIPASLTKIEPCTALIPWTQPKPFDFIAAKAQSVPKVINKNDESESCEEENLNKNIKVDPLNGMETEDL